MPVPYKHILSLPQIEIIPGFKARMIHSDMMTTAFWQITEGATLPEHQHIHEQISIVTKGELELIIDGKPQIYRPGMVVVIPSNVPHSGRAVTYCEVTDIWSPVREDYVAKGLTTG